MGDIDVRNVADAKVDASSWGPYVRFEHDTLDSRYFPIRAPTGTSRGYSAVRLDNNSDIDDRYEGVNYHLAMVKPWSWDRHSLNLLLEGGALPPRKSCRCSCRIWAGCSACPASSAIS